ncbi:asparagine synthase (glutamine-hydrolyzing) [Pullulanibacillus pueri]|uniref:asparagine synthase (glutamine-hydrolyzing) n=1 Tax=Pullulanibacillus pueri TaxID=1437324 RepID=A0A8J2ZSN0_9BACL|nr:asparagine synthase (glutamine-hydrolyzing) [Pullulanibacillus pueri]MBM7680443.1 asparagine synthase (glutamine-hydrolyzing) [Pullulanibacillus pueri]GGH75065.1 asparagine synthetase B [Pullulanibacillus pueri]
MCGFVGFVSNRLLEPGKHEQNNMVERTNIITHRGPDDNGFYTDDTVQFGFRRLSIIDLEGGHQPLSFEDDRFHIIFNGEIYNYLEIKEELVKEGVTFSTTSDTEVILALYATRGEEAVKSLRGMFGFVIWDKQEKKLFAARDPFGIKPFYYMETNDGTFFASEKKSLLIGEEPHPVAQEALQHYLTFQFVPEPETMNANIRRLAPGHYLTKKVGEEMVIKSYWKPTFSPSNQGLDEAKKSIREALRDSVQMHMRSDVPVGAFLSSGIDSTSIVALAKEFHPNIQTFTVGFEREGYSEIDIAKDSAEKLGVENIHTVITPEAFIEELPKIIWHMDDPVADPAAIPLYFVAKEASKHVKVVLSGEGADELFGGYNIYREPLDLKWLKKMPKGTQRFIKSVANKLPSDMKGRSFLIRGCTPMEERYVGNAFMFDEDEKRFIMKHHRETTHFTQVTSDIYARANRYTDVETMQYVDIHTWLRGDILVKADRMTMAHSLELRVPFLDKEVFAVASKIPSELKTANKTTKYALREAMRGIVPDSILYRKKLGFPVPIRVWLKNELYDWAKNLIRESGTDEWINKSYVYKLLDDHRNDKRDNSRKIWTTLIFMLWHQIYVEKAMQQSSEKARLR